MTCPDANELSAYVGGAQTGAAAATVAAHLGDCWECRAVVLAIGATQSGGRSPPEAPPIERGTVLGRYLIVERIGQGGMGVVYAAYDPELDRRVALKVIRPDREEDGQARLVREARAQARLAHPNVVAVHDVGALGDRVFVAMELVAGATLRTWLATPRPWREVLAMFVAAGRGLVAAHGAGLVHRDFKPDNVLVGGDGRPRVTDFGLARVGVAAGADAATGTAAIAGTPAYMAPEQLRGVRVGPAADQFSFCVSLYEGLMGKRPFGGATVTECLGAIEAARAEPARGVPAVVGRALARGLATRPDERFASMAELLGALDLAPRGRRRRAAALGAIVVAVGAGAFALKPVPRPAALCRAAAGELAGIWDPTVRVAVRTALAATGRPYADDTFATVARQLDSYAGAWTAMRTEACEATHVRGTQSEQLLDLRTACLDRRRGEVAAATALLARTDVQVLDRAVAVVARLEPIAPCADGAALTASVPPPGPELRPRVDALRLRLATARALMGAAKHTAALQAVALVAVEASQIDYAPLAAESLFLVATLQEEMAVYLEADATTTSALAAAALARDDLAVARVNVLRYKLLLDLDRFDAAQVWLPSVETALVRAGDPPLERALLDVSRTEVEVALNHRPAALVYAEASLALRRAALGPVHVDVATSLAELAHLSYVDGDFEAARAHMEEALRIHEALYGPRHPRVATDYANLGVILHAEGKHEESRRAYERAIAILEGTPGHGVGDLAGDLNNLANLLTEEDKLDEARALFRRALTIRTTIMGPEHRDVALVWENLALLEARAGNFAEARRDNDEAIRGYTLTLGPEHPNLGEAYSARGDILWGLGDRAGALASYQRALAMMTKAVGPDHFRTGGILVPLGWAQLRAGDPAAAATLSRARAIGEKSGPDNVVLDEALVGLGLLEVRGRRSGAGLTLIQRGLAIRERRNADPRALAEARFALAQALWADPAARARARALAVEAERTYAAAPGAKAELAEVRAWLAGARPEARNPSP